LKLKKNEASKPEAYRLEIQRSGIEISASAEKGLFYGVQTLRQLVKNGSTPCLVIEDEPRFEWRACMLDEARWFQGTGTVKKLLDEMALLKLNTFHWHLTNDAGWRIEIDGYPLLTEVGAIRDSTQINDNGKKWASTTYDGKPHRGFYTKDRIREIIAYAAERYIDIVPEVSMPGHASAAVAAYPWLGTVKEPIEVPTAFGVVATVFNPADERVTDFLHEVLTQVAELFPSDVIHIGGDEVKYDQWQNSPEITAYMKEHGLKTYSDVQVNFTNDMSGFIEKNLHRRMMGWNEILGKNVHEWSSAQNSTAKLSKSAIIHFWKGEAPDFRYAIDQGHQVVNSSHGYTYLDYTYGQISLSKAYHFEPVPDGLTEDEERQILGLGCQMWGEWTPSNLEVEYQTYPRLAAYAEVGWSTKENRDYTRFRENIAPLMARWKALGYNIPSLSEAEAE
jgi:hexosaminidase